jgi:protein TonB
VGDESLKQSAEGEWRATAPQLVMRPPLPGRRPPPELLELWGPRRLAKRRRVSATSASLAVHAALIVAAFVIPVLGPVALPPQLRDPVTVLLYDPPPPPPLPLPRGNPLLPRAERPPSRRAEPRPEPTPPTETPVLMPRAVVPVDLVAPEPRRREGGGSDTGSDLGVPEGMEGGVAEGQIGGVPGGVVGGVVGGRLGGLLPVRDYDRAPRLIRSVKPRYPQEAFVKKIQGVVVLEILIDASGRVVDARVLQSIPLLDAAAIAAVKQWVFQPAARRGRPVPTLANAPITFRIY